MSGLTQMSLGGEITVTLPETLAAGWLERTAAVAISNSAFPVWVSGRNESFIVINSLETGAWFDVVWMIIELGVSQNLQFN